MLYEKTNCEVCGSEFGNNDDIVVCPVCGTPHHRDCWMKTGKCVNEEKHENGFVWTAPEKEIEDAEAQAKESVSENDDPVHIVCPNCGAECPPNSLVCHDCGEKFGLSTALLGAQQGFTIDNDYFLRGVDADPNDNIDGVSARDAATYIQMRSSRYIPKFIRMSAENKKLSWNWAAFFLSPLWFFYRKLYKAGALFLGLTFIAFTFGSMPMLDAQKAVSGFVTENFDITNETTIGELTDAYNSLKPEEQQTFLKLAAEYSRCAALLGVALMTPNIFAALYSNYLYKSKMVKEVRSMRKFSLDDRTFTALALRRGGVSLLAAVGCYLAYTLFTDYVFKFL